ncbi:MAG: hypothetical protein ABH879_06245 [archaeon]
MRNVLVVGFGQIGKSVYSIVRDSGQYNLYKKDVEDLEISEKIDIMHICIPFGDEFEAQAIGCINSYSPRLTIIESTVRPGTTQNIYRATKKHIVHSPVRGRHPHLEGGLLKFVKFIGPATEEAGKLAKEYYQTLGLRVEVMGSPVNTELGKLLSTTYYAVNIAFHQDMDRICSHYGADFNEAVKRFNETGTIDIEHKLPRPVMYPGFIGGHCLIPNINILKKDINSAFLDAILDSNKRTKE